MPDMVAVILTILFIAVVAYFIMVWLDCRDLGFKTQQVIWSTATSPASAAYTDYFSGKLETLHPSVLWSNQAGLAMALLCARLHVRSCKAFRVSACGLEEFNKHGIQVEYEELIPLVRSSKDETMVCPVEQFLADHTEEEERWRFLMDKYAGTESKS